MRLASVADHKRVADAILAGKAALAEESMRKLVEEALDLITTREERKAPRRPAGAGR